MNATLKDPGAPRMLVVSNDSSQIEGLRGYFASAGFEVLSADDPRSGLAALESHGAEVGLIDLDLPAHDAFQLLAALRHSERWRDLPLIVLTSLDRPHLRIRALEAGADDCVVQPFHRAELQARVRALLRRVRGTAASSSYLRGDLSEMPLSLLLQTLAYAGRTATVVFPERRRIQLADPLAPGDLSGSRVEVSSPLRALGAWGLVAIRQGLLVDALYREHRGFEALIRLALCHSGRFETHFDEALLSTSEEAAGASVDGAMLKAMVTIDDVRLLLPSIVDLDSALLAHGAPAEERNGRPLTARTFLLGWPGSLVEGAEELRAAIADGRLTPAPREP